MPLLLERGHMAMNRRQFCKASVMCGVSAGVLGSTCHAIAMESATTPVVPGPEIDAYKKAQSSLLRRYDVAAASRYVVLNEPKLTVHVLEIGQGDPVLLLHGGGNFACQFAPLMSALQTDLHVFAADRPGCGLSDKIDYRDIALRQHAVAVVTSMLDGLGLPKAALVGHSMGGLWALSFALAKPERVTKLVLLGEPAWSAAVAHAPPPAPKIPTIESVRATYVARLVADVTRVPHEMLEASLAANRLPGAAHSWDTLIHKFLQERVGTYHLRPELKKLYTPTLFVWGDNDKFGPPTLGQEMAAMAPNAHCEVLSDAGHLVWVDQTKRCGRLTLDFLKKA
jgi:pimeloyl-ACP methyl ester carboxylesterase